MTTRSFGGLYNGESYDQATPDGSDGRKKFHADVKEGSHPDFKEEERLGSMGDPNMININSRTNFGTGTNDLSNQPIVYPSNVVEKETWIMRKYSRSKFGSNEKTGQKKQYSYYWKLSNPTVPKIAPPRYYPVDLKLASDKGSTGNKKPTNKIQEMNDGARFRFLPESLWNEYKNWKRDGEKLSPENEVKGVVLDARGMIPQQRKKTQPQHFGPHYRKGVELKPKPPSDPTYLELGTVPFSYEKKRTVFELFEETSKRRIEVEKHLHAHNFRLESDGGVVFDKPENINTDIEYVRLRKDIVASLITTGGRSGLNKSDIYISQELIEYWAGVSRTKDWKLVNYENMTDEDKEDKAEDDEEDEEDDIPATKKLDIPGNGFEERVAANSDKTWSTVNPKRFWVRDGEGVGLILNLESRIGTDASNWAQHLLRSIRIRGEGGAWTRTLNPDVPLVLVPVDGKGRNELESFANKAYGRGKCNQKPTVMTEEEVKKANGEKAPTAPRYIKMSTSPFNDYETWVMSDRYDEYLAMYPDRKLPQSNEEFKKIRQVLPNYNKGDLVPGKIMKKIFVDAREREKDKLVVPTADDSMLEEISKADDSEPKPPVDSMLAISVSVNKINSAKGQRQTVQGQRQVMGKSATTIADSLGWGSESTTAQTSDVKEKWPATVFAKFEWLHRCAFSWGGLHTNFNTSQQGQNFVFGTSECNSIMTRYEKSWQGLVTRTSATKGTLYTDSRYGNVQIREPNKQWVMQAQPQNKIYKETPWLCFVLEYSLYLPIRTGKPLPAGGFYRQFFYPFQRGFFTVLEQRVDMMFLEKHCALYGKNKAPEVMDNNIEAENNFLSLDMTKDGNFYAKIISVDETEKMSEEIDTLKIAEGENPEVSLGSDPPASTTDISQYITVVDEPDAKSGVKEQHDMRAQSDWNIFSGVADPNANSERLMATDATSSIMWKLTANGVPEMLMQTVPKAMSSPEDALLEPQIAAIFESRTHIAGPTIANGLVPNDEIVTGSGTTPLSLLPSVSTQLQASSLPLGTASSFAPAEPDLSLRNLPKKTTQASLSTSLASSPGKYVSKRTIKLFGKLNVELKTLQSPSALGTYQLVDVPDEISLGKLIPSLENSDMNMIKLRQTTITYKTEKTFVGSAETAELKISTSIYLAGFLDPVNEMLQKVFKQTDSHIDVTGTLSTYSGSLFSVPTPTGFCLRGELPKVNVSLFNVLRVTHLGLDIIGTRKSSKGGYDMSYGFFGQGSISNINVNWYIRKHHDLYHIMVSTKSESWMNLCGIQGINVDNLLLQASWTGTNINSVMLEAECSLSLRSSPLVLRGAYSKHSLELSAALKNCTLETLQGIYEEIFKTKVDTKTTHEILFRNISFAFSSKGGITLTGAVTVDGHTSVEATIALSSSGISIKGSIGSLDINKYVNLESANLDLSITSHGLSVSFSGDVRVERHTVKVSVYFKKESDRNIEYTLYGAYQGDLRLRDLVPGLEGTFFDEISLLNIAICASNMETSTITVEDNVLSYPIKKGLQVYAQIESIKEIDKIIRSKEPRRLTVCAFYTPPVAGGTASFGINLQLPTTDLISFDRMRSGPLEIGVRVSGKQAYFRIISVIYIKVSGNKEELSLGLELAADMVGAKGIAQLEGPWVNPYNLCNDLTIKKLTGGIGINYAQFCSSGTPSSVTFGGDFQLSQFEGKMMFHLGENPEEQLVSLEMLNLDVATLMSLVHKLLNETNVEPPMGADTFYVRHLLIYVSTGVHIKDREYPRGIEFDADVTILGKKAKLNAVINSSQVKCKGSIDAFSIGDVSIEGAKKDEAGPSIDLEISSSEQKIHISGFVKLKDDHLLIDMHIDSGKGQFYFFFDVVVSDTLKIRVKAELEGPPPDVVKKPYVPASSKDGDNATTTKSEESKAITNGSEVAEKPGTITNPPVGGRASRGGVLGVVAELRTEKIEQLFNRKFNLHALVESDSDILRFIINMINEHFEKEGDPSRKQTLKAELEHATEVLSLRKKELSLKEKELRDVVDKKQAELAVKLSASVQQRELAAATLLQLQSSSVLQERDLSVKIEQEQQEFARVEREKALVAKTRAREAFTASLDCNRLRETIELTKTRCGEAAEKVAAIEVEMASLMRQVEESVSEEPMNSDAAHEAWSWTHADLMQQLEVKQMAVQLATAEYNTVAASYNQRAYEITTWEVDQLAEQAVQADKAFMEQKSSIKEKIEKNRKDGDNKLNELKRQLKGEIYVAEIGLSKAEAEEKATRADRDAELAKLTKANDIQTTDEFKAMQVASKKKTNAAIAVSSFDELLWAINKEADAYTLPLRFIIKQVGTDLISIKRMEIKGEWTGKAGKVEAEVDALVGLAPFTFNIEFAITNIAEFFRGLFVEIGKVISPVAAAFQDMLKKGIEYFDSEVAKLKLGTNFLVMKGKEYYEELPPEFRQGVDAGNNDAKATVKEIGDKAKATGGILKRGLQHDVDTSIVVAESLRQGASSGTDTAHGIMIEAGDKIRDTGVKAYNDIQPTVEVMAPAVSDFADEANEKAKALARAVREKLPDVSQVPMPLPMPPLVQQAGGLFDQFRRRFE